MAESSTHMRTYFERSASYLFKWSVANFSKIKGYRNSIEFMPFNTFECSVQLSGLPEYLRLYLYVCECELFKCYVSLRDINGRELLSSSTTCTDSSNILELSQSKDEFKKLKNLPKDTLEICCLFVQETSNSVAVWDGPKSDVDGEEYRRKLAADLNSMVSTEGTLYLCVGGETLTVNKAVLSSRSPVFASMFQSKMEEQVDNAVAITDVQMSVMRSFVFFLYNGVVSQDDFEHLCELYYAADKYGFSELREVCSNLLPSKVSVETACQLLSLSERHNNQGLKFSAITFIFTNRESVMKRDDWKALMDVQPKLALEAVTFFYPKS